MNTGSDLQKRSAYSRAAKKLRAAEMCQKRRMNTHTIPMKETYILSIVHQHHIKGYKRDF